MPGEVRATSALEPGLGLLREADQERSDRNATDHLNGAGGDRRGAHPIAPIRTASRSATTRPIRYATYVPRRPL